MRDCCIVLRLWNIECLSDVWLMCGLIIHDLFDENVVDYVFSSWLVVLFHYMCKIVHVVCLVHTCSHIYDMYTIQGVMNDEYLYRQRERER